MSNLKKMVAAVLGAGLLVTTLASGASAATTVTAQLNGAAEVPGPGDPDGMGRARIRVEPNEGWLCFRVGWRDIARPKAAHVHRGGPAVAGPVKVELFAGAALPASIDAVHGCVENVRERLLRKIQRHPERFYVNVHNRPFPDGAIRGQLG